MISYFKWAAVKRVASPVDDHYKSCTVSKNSDQSVHPRSLLSLRCEHEGSTAPKLFLEGNQYRSYHAEHTGW